MSSKKRIADALEAILQGMAALEAKVGAIAVSQGRMEAAVTELSRDVVQLRERMIEEAEIRAGVGLSVLDHDIQLSLIRGGRSDGE